MTSKEIRQKYLEFFQKQGHAIIPSASLFPENDSTTLFTSSGMQPLVPYLMGEKHPAGARLADIQKSFRADDIEEIGDQRHTTFFEMLGNWSLGDYFKKEQLSWYFEFLTKNLGINPERLYISVFLGNKEIGIPRDTEASDIWKKIFKDAGLDALDADSAMAKGICGNERIFYYPDKKNWWSRSGIPANMPIGEIGGPDSEVFFDLGSDLKRHENSQWKNNPCHINCDCGRFVEIGNSVFMEYIRTANGFEKLKQRNVDFGGGLERTVMAIQGKDNIFETDLFAGAIAKIEELSGRKYRENMKAFEVVADHIKAATLIMGDDKGVAPSNTDQGYIVRRLIRRAIRYGKQIGINRQDWTKNIAEKFIEIYADVYDELVRNQEFILHNLQEEEIKFAKTLERGVGILEDRSSKAKNSMISGADAFDLYQTYGFPIEMTKELADEKGLGVDIAGFQEELKKHQELSRTASAGKFKGGLADQSEATTMLHTAAHLMLAALRIVLGGHVHQKGSNITAERLRFDFSHQDKLTEEQKRSVENLVNEQIQKGLAVSMREMNINEAREFGAEGVFASKYGENVKVFTIGTAEGAFSKEICGGPHVENIGLLGRFKIQKEESSSAGVRRIKAVLEAKGQHE